MVTLFWYYRPEDTGIQSTDFQEVTLHIAMNYNVSSDACIQCISIAQYTPQTVHVLYICNIILVTCVHVYWIWEVRLL